MANSNGTMAAGQNGGVYNSNTNNNSSNNAGMNSMPAAGHYSDMQTLMQNMEALSGWLQQNREDFLRVQEDLEKVERLQLVRPSAAAGSSTVAGGGGGGGGGGLGTDGDIQADDDDDDAGGHRPTIIGLQRELDASKAHIEALEQQSSEHLKLQAQYEEVLTQAVDKTRNYVFGQNEYIISLHQHYTGLLQQARRETIDVQLMHQAWQASLSRLDEELKHAVKAREHEKDPFRRRLAMLKEENRVMREKLGWEKIVHESDEESDDELSSVDRGRSTTADEHVMVRR